MSDKIARPFFSLKNFLPQRLCSVSAAVGSKQRSFHAGLSRSRPTAAKSSEDDESCVTAGNSQFNGLKKTLLHQVPLIWLRDCCQCPLRMHKNTHQRSSIQSSDDAFTTSPTIKSISSSSSYQTTTFDIVWSDGHHSTYDEAFIEHQFLPSNDDDAIRPRLWTATQNHSQLNSTFCVGQLESAQGKAKILTHLLKHGFALITGVQPSECATLRAVSSIAEPFNSIYGIVSTFTSDASRSDTAYTTLPLAPHTDTTYYQTPLRIMALHCIERNADTIGGESMFVDGFEIARQLREKDCELYEALFKVPQEFCYIERSAENHFTLSSVCTVLRAKTGPAFVCEPEDLLRVRFNMYDRGFRYLGSSAEDLQKLHEALHEFQRLSLCERNQWKTILQPGTLALYDNWRVLHARTAFKGRRTLTSAYIAEEQFSSALTKYGVVSSSE